MAGKKAAASEATAQATSVVKSMTGKELNFTSSMPMTLGDGAALQRVGAMDKRGNLLLAGDDVDLEMQAQILLHFAKKADKDVTLDDVYGLRVEDIEGVMAYFAEAFNSEDPDPST